MKKTVVEGDSNRYPYLTVEIKTRKKNFYIPVLVDTGCTAGIILPSEFIRRLGEPDGDDVFTLANGSPTPVVFYEGSVMIGRKEIPTEIYCWVEYRRGWDTLLGRRVIDNFETCFNGRKRSLRIFNC